MQLKLTQDILAYQKQNYPKADAISTKVDGKWVRYSTDEVIGIVKRLSVAMMNVGIEKGDRVAIYSNNRAEWNFADLACMMVGAISVPIYMTLSQDDLAYIINHSSCKLVFVSDGIQYQKIQAIPNLNPQIHYISFDKVEGLTYWEAFIQSSSIEGLPELEIRQSEISPEHCASIIYTSGTTGNPKGVMLSHANLVFNMTTAIEGVLPDQLLGRTRALSFLPLCHIAERILNLIYIYYGISIYHAESIDTISRDLQDVQPQFFVAVPRLLEKVYEKILAKGAELSGLKRMLFDQSIRLAEAYYPGQKKTLKHRILDTLVFKKWREAVGGNIVAIGCGAAPLQAKLVKVFYAAGLPILEAYGLTETAPFISATQFDISTVKPGVAGKIVAGIEVKIADDGEILCKGPNVMMGYYHNEEATAEAIIDGWFHTGDIGEIVEGQFLKITDRKKEIFKTSGGKYIAPGYLENLFKTSKWIDHVMVVGENQKFPSALIVPAFETLEYYCQSQNIPITDPKQYVMEKHIIDLYESEIEKINANLGQWEKIKKFKLLHREWGIESGELTPTLKLKRRVIKKNHEEDIQSFYR